MTLNPRFGELIFLALKIAATPFVHFSEQRDTLHLYLYRLLEGEFCIPSRVSNLTVALRPVLKLPSLPRKKARKPENRRERRVGKLAVAYGGSSKLISLARNRPVARTKKRSTMDFPSALLAIALPLPFPLPLPHIRSQAGENVREYLAFRRLIVNIR